MSVILILIALVLLIAGVWAGLSMLAGYTQVFTTAAGGFVVPFFPLFLLGPLFGKAMEASGAAERLADAIAAAVGSANAMLAVGLAYAVLTYGGMSLFVVAFAAWPLARALFAETGLPAQVIPAIIEFGAFTFTMTALPGTPSIQNAIPMEIFGTTPFAAPGLGLIAGAVMLVLGLGWLRYRARALSGDAPPDMPEHPPSDRPLPLWVAMVPILSVGIVTLAMGILVLATLETGYLSLPLHGDRPAARRWPWSVIEALTVVSVLALTLSRPSRLMETLNRGAESALLPLFNTASLVGFGAVIASLPGFEVLRLGLNGMVGGHVVVSAALS